MTQSLNFLADSKRFHILIDLITIVFLSFVVRIALCGHGFTDVEAQAIGIANLSNLGAIVEAAKLDGNPPLFLFLIRGWSFLFSGSEFSLKFLALLLSGLLPPITYWVILNRLGRKIALQTAILMVFCPTLICVTNLLRPHAAVAIITLLATDQLFNLLLSPQSWWSRLKYSFLISSLLYFHMLAINIPLAHAIYIVVAFSIGWLTREKVFAWIVASLGAVILFLPWMHSVIGVVEQSTQLWHQYSNMLTYELSVFYMLMNKVSDAIPLQPASIIFSVLIILTMLLFQPKEEQCNSATGYRWLRQFYFIGITSLIASYLVFAFAVHVLRDRYISHLIVFILLLYTTAMHRITYKRATFLTLWLPVLICLFFWLPQLFTIRALADDSMYQAVQIIKRNYDQDKDLIVCASMPYVPVLTRELSAEYRVIAFPDIQTRRMTYVKFDGQAKKIRDEQNFADIELIMTDTLNKGGHIWFLEPKPREDVEGRTDFRIGDNEDFCVAELIAARRLRLWLFEHARAETASRRLDSYYASIQETCFIAK